MEIRNGKRQNFLSIVIIVAAACLVHGTMQGVHDNYGIMMHGLLRTTGVDYAGISFCIGVGALVYGVAQPFLGMLALRRSNVFVILLGIVFTVVGLVVTPLCRSLPALLLFFGLILPFGTTGLCFGIVMGAITPVIGEKRAAVVSGIVQASAGIGDALMSPWLESMIAGRGVQCAMTAATIPFFIMVGVVMQIMRHEKKSQIEAQRKRVQFGKEEQRHERALTYKISRSKRYRACSDVIPVAVWIGSANRTRAAAPKDEALRGASLTSILRGALRDRDYRLLVMGFATCGFNMSIIEGHLFSQYLSYGIEGKTASLALTVYGIATMIGAVAVGFLGTRFRMKNVLGCVYSLRVLISLGFLLLPKTVPFAFAATALLGMSGDSTVPPTSGIISSKFGAEKMAVLYGFTLIGHQIGACASSNLGGLLVKLGLGYGPLWAVNMILAAFAAACSFQIRYDDRAAGRH